ncbi:MAG: hypothetical protein J6112_00605 [Clostridia bacterium]|nr:hypothetical protein [Clostridia bacterium]
MSLTFFFPYLFIQSGVKPVVERTQIEEYAKMVKFFDESDKIIVLGYRLNYDDNHINSIIRSAVKQNKEVVYLSFNDKKVAPLSNKEVHDKLKLPMICPSLKFFEIDGSNASRVFEEELTK